MENRIHSLSLAIFQSIETAKPVPAAVDRPAAKQPAQPKKGRKKAVLDDDESDAASIKSSYSDDEDDFASKKKPAAKKTVAKQAKPAEPTTNAIDAPVAPALTADDAKPTQKKAPAKGKGKVSRCCFFVNARSLLL